MGASNLSSLILSKSVNVRHRFHIRVHKPQATEKIASEFDMEVDKVLKTWFGILADSQIKWARIPLKLGGFGLSSTYALRENSYESSCHASLERRKLYSAQDGGRVEVSLSKVIPDEEEAVELKLHKQVKEELCKDPKIGRVISATSRKGSYQWLHATERYIPPAQFTLSVMPRLGIRHPKLPDSLLCPGCKTLLNAAIALTHIPGCVRCSGINATTKHNSLTRYIYELCLKAGLPCAREPREFTTYTCSACSQVLSEETKIEHSKLCRGAVLNRSGPDLVIYWASGATYYDLTVVHELSPSYEKMSPQKAMQDAIPRKHTKYVKSSMLQNDQFQCLPISSCGALHNNTKSLLQILAGKVYREPKAILNDFVLLQQELDGAILQSQLRSYLPDTKDDYAC